MKKAIMVLSILCGGLLVGNPMVNTSFAQEQNISGVNKIENSKEESGAEVVQELNQEQAKDFLELYNSNIEYTFQGDENVFEALKEKGLEGYVFLGNVDGDLGYFVDKNTANLYYFHPSGYLDIIL